MRLRENACLAISPTCIAGRGHRDIQKREDASRGTQPAQLRQMAPVSPTFGQIRALRERFRLHPRRPAFCELRARVFRPPSGESMMELPPPPPDDTAIQAVDGRVNGERQASAAASRLRPDAPRVVGARAYVGSHRGRSSAVPPLRLQHMPRAWHRGVAADLGRLEEVPPLQQESPSEQEPQPQQLPRSGA